MMKTTGGASLNRKGRNIAPAVNYFRPSPPEEGSFKRPTKTPLYGRNDSKELVHPKINHVEEIQCFNLYVRNLPKLWSRAKIIEKFCRFGDVLQVLVPNKMNKWGKRFGFVRMGLDMDILWVIDSLHGALFDANRIVVRQAKSFDFKAKMPVRKSDFPRVNYVPTSAFQQTDKRSFQDVAKGAMGSDDSLIRIKPLEENDDWLGRSLVGWLSTPCSPSVAAEKLNALLDIDVDIRYMGGNMLLMTCSSLLDFNFMINNKELLSQLFVKVKKWEQEDVGNMRLAWIRCAGVPLHVWGPDVFQLIGAVWGDYVSLDKAIMEKVSLDSGRVLVRTAISYTIAGVVNIVVGSKTFKVSVFEECFEGFNAGSRGLKNPVVKGLNEDGVSVKEKGMAGFQVADEFARESFKLAGESKLSTNSVAASDHGDPVELACSLKVNSGSDVLRVNALPPSVPLQNVGNVGDAISGSYGHGGGWFANL